MPLYDFACPDCGEFTLARSLANRNSPANCPECHSLAIRVITAPQLSLMSSNRREAYARNEKSCHEPRSLTRHRCGTGCGCGKPSQRSTKRKVNLGKAGMFEASSKPKRPWMLGH